MSSHLNLTFLRSVEMLGVFCAGGTVAFHPLNATEEVINNLPSRCFDVPFLAMWRYQSGSVRNLHVVFQVQVFRSGKFPDMLFHWSVTEIYRIDQFVTNKRLLSFSFNCLQSWRRLTGNVLLIQRLVLTFLRVTFQTKSHAQDIYANRKSQVASHFVVSHGFLDQFHLWSRMNVEIYEDKTRTDILRHA